MSGSKSWLYDETKAEKHLKVASVTMRCDLRPEVNRDRMRDWIQRVKLAHPDVQLVLFGETVLGRYAVRGGSKEYHQRIAEPIPGETTELMRGIAREQDIYLSFGISERCEEDVFNTQVLIDPNGDVIARHRKYHLMESAGVFKAGDVPVTMVDINGVRTGIIVCSDIQSPIVRKELSNRKPELILGGLASPDDPKFFISGMIAKMFDAWIVTANRYGDEDIYIFDGNIVIGDPLGRLRVKTMGKDGFVFYQLNFVPDPSRLRKAVRRIYVGASLIPHFASNLGMMLASIKDRIKIPRKAS
jgi:predicted amidohydrolase